MSETQVVQQTYVTTTESREMEETSLDEEKVRFEAEKTSLTEDEELTDYEEHVHQYDGGNSEAVSISSSKLQELPSHNTKVKTSVVKFANNVNNMSLSIREELLEKFGQCTECNRPNTGEN